MGLLGNTCDCQGDKWILAVCILLHSLTYSLCIFALYHKYKDNDSKMFLFTLLLGILSRDNQTQTGRKMLTFKKIRFKKFEWIFNIVISGCAELQLITELHSAEFVCLFVFNSVQNGLNLKSTIFQLG